MQFSLGWAADDLDPTFHLWWGTGGQVNDAAAWGGTAFRLGPPTPDMLETFAWVWTTEFIKDVPFVAYFRLKVADNSSSAPVARVSVKGGGTDYGPLYLKGTDFSAANKYQEFAVPFTFNTNPNDVFLTFQFWRTGSTDVYVDGVSIFTAPQPFNSSMTWNVPGANYRGQGVWVRNTNGGNLFSNFTQVNTTLPSLGVTPPSIFFLARRNGTPPASQWLTVLRNCGNFSWQVSGSPSWLQTQPQGNAIRVSVNQTSLATGMYQGTLTVSAVGVSGVSPVSVPVTLFVADQFIHLPFIAR
jgi:hypothetical protein